MISNFPYSIQKCRINTDKEILPITRLNFGRTQQSYSSGVHTLGRFECTGQVAVTGMPTANVMCRSLEDRTYSEWIVICVNRSGTTTSTTGLILPDTF